MPHFWGGLLSFLPIFLRKISFPKRIKKKFLESPLLRARNGCFVRVLTWSKTKMTIEDQSSFSIMIINHRFNHRAISIRSYRFWIGMIYSSAGGLIPPGWGGIRLEGGANRCMLILGRIGSEFELHCWMHSDGIRFGPDGIGLIRCASSMLTGSGLWEHSDRWGDEFDTNSFLGFELHCWMLLIHWMLSNREPNRIR